MKTILFVDDMKTFRDQFAYDLRRKTGFEVLTAGNGKETLNILREKFIDIMILDLEMPEMDGLETLEQMKEENLVDIPIVVYTGTGNFQKCVKAVQMGAYNFLDKSEVKLDRLVQELHNAMEHNKMKLEIQELRHAAGKDSTLLGASSELEDLRKQIQRVARVPSNVLILGESGTGKELVAKEIHRMSDRADKPFVALNCAALPENLVESELFGFEKGAFSGAVRTSRGKFEMANGGVLLLDEIGDMPLGIQAKLLRVIQESEVNRLGSESRPIKIDVRIITATNKDLETEMQEGNFRDDLYFRICTHKIEVPPLRNHPDDVKPLAIHFVNRTCDRFRISRKSIHSDTLAEMKKYDWRRNNVRELENIVERMIIQCDGEEILPSHIPPDIRNNKYLPSFSSVKSFQDLKREAEKQILEKSLLDHDWHITKTAKALGIANHSNLLKMMRRLNIRRPKEE
jgi:two-component system nitrogen regulation response regulator NtrX